MINKIKEISDKEFIELIKNSTNIKEVLFKLGYTTVGNSWGYSQIKERMLILNLTPYDFKGKSELAKSQNKKVKTEDLFNNKKHPRVVIRKRIIKENLIPYKCAICGIDSWNGKRLSLELDHINGINNDNRLENLRFLCPNCHSQTSTYGSKNSMIQQSDFNITKEIEDIILNGYKKYKSIIKTAKELGYKKELVRQVINNNGLNKINLKFVIRYDLNHKEIKRYGSLSEMCKCLIEANEVRTKSIKVCRTSFLRNYKQDNNKIWLNSYWKILDA